MSQEKAVKTKISLNIKNPEKVVSEIFELPIFKTEREKSILLERFGIFGHKKKTLEAIGKNLGITRERVRQIEKNALKKIRTHKESKELVRKIGIDLVNFLKDNGQLFSETIIPGKITGKKEVDDNTANCLYLLLSLEEDIKYIKENDLHYSIWSLDEVKVSEISEFIKKAVLELEEKCEIISEEKLIKLIAEDEDNVYIKNILESSKLLLKKDQSLGLRSWRSINPKSINDKILVILKELVKPLHYSDITVQINNSYAKGKKITEKAVHNELIKDDKFILIGRGIYALSEWGYRDGTVKDVILEILEEEGRPLHKKEIIEKVLQKRLVKEATIILNLQNFKRVGKATYTIN